MSLRKANLLKAILLKVCSALIFALMSTLIKQVQETLPVGQTVFFRSAFAIPPVVLLLVWRRELLSALRTSRPGGHLVRGLGASMSMFLNFAALTYLPLVDATAINFVTPLIVVGLAALILRERVRIYRWSAVAVGFLGVVVMLLPNFNFSDPARTSSAAAIGAALALGGSILSAGTVIQTRRLTRTEDSSSIVLYFSLVCALIALPVAIYDWHPPNWWELSTLIAIGTLGGVGHLMLTESYRFSTASVIAPFDYTQLFWAFILGYLVFGETPAALVYVGAAIISGAGLFVVWRERQLRLQRARELEGPPTGAS